MEFPDFGRKMIIKLEEANVELCDEIWDALPFTCVQEHGMVSGYMIYCWIPLISLAGIHKKMLHTESPVGCVNYSQGTGNKIIVKYDECNEDLSAPVLGYVPEEYWEDLRAIGHDIWFNYFHDKRIFTVTFNRLEEGV